MAREPLRRGATSPSPLSSPTPSAVSAFAVRKDTSSPFTPSAAFRDVASPLGASHASLSTDPVHATLSPRPMSPVGYRIDHSAPTTSAVSSSALNRRIQLSASSQASHAAQSGAGGSGNGSNFEKSRSNATTKSAQPTDERASERAFYRRILFQDLPTATEASAITHDADLDHEIYLLLAYLLRETVLPWYSKLTPDREFLTQITSIITSIINTVVQRQTLSGIHSPSAVIESDIHAPRTASNAQLPRVHDLLSRDVPLIVRQHYSDFRQAQIKADSVWAPLGTQQGSSTTAFSISQVEQDEQRRQCVRETIPSAYRKAFESASESTSPLLIAQLFHAASPHPGIDPTNGSLDGKFDVAYLRIAVLNLLSSLLPADEYAPDTEKFVVRDVLVSVLRGSLARSFRPWFFVQSMHKVLDALDWPKQPVLPSAANVNSIYEQPLDSNSQTTPSDAITAILELIARLPAILIKLWAFIALTALPFLVRAYLDLFNVHRAASRKRRQQQQLRQQQQQEDERAERGTGIATKGRFPSSLSTGSLYERKMHGRFPSRKFQFNQDDTLIAQGRSSAIDANATLTAAELAAAQDATSGAEFRLSDQGAPDLMDAPPDYLGNWLSAVEVVMQDNSHGMLRAGFGFARTILGTTGLDGTLNRIAVRRIEAELRNTLKLTGAVRELRRILLPNGHLPPSMPDPDVETQEAEWIRLRTRLVCGAASNGSVKESFLPWLMRRILLGSADSKLNRGDPVQDTQIQLQRLSTWLEPLCSPPASGPNTLLAILLFERVIVALCPDLTLTQMRDNSSDE